MQEDFHMLVNELQRSTHKDEADAILNHFLDGTRISNHGYVGFRGDGYNHVEPHTAGNYPEGWAQQWINDQLYTKDPVMTQILQSNLPVPWTSSELQGLNEGAVFVMETAAKYGIRHGFTVPIRSSRGQLAVLSYCLDGSTTDYTRMLDQDTAKLHLAAMYYHAAIERLNDAERPRLTQRERQCLFLAAQGMTSKESARVLGIVERSVKFHLENARLKLGAANRSQAVYLAGRWKLLDDEVIARV